jgi:hypothetical protein
MPKIVRARRVLGLLLLTHNFYDIALRDFGLSLGALALARLGADFDHKHHVEHREEVIRERP